MKTGVTPLMLLTAAVLLLPGARSLVMDQTLLDLTKRAAVLAQTAYNRPPYDVQTIAGPDAIYFENEPDAALLSREDGDRCFLAFRATTPSAVDWYQNIDARLTTMCVNDSSDRCCQVRRGFFDAYTKPSYYLQLEQAVDECMTQCGEGCELTITGTSQGSAIATIAGIALADYKPFLITFGQPPTVLDDCSNILPDDRFLRFQNSIITEEFGFQYDLVCYLRGHLLDRNGQFLLMGDDDKNLKLYEPHLLPTVRQDRLTKDASTEAHRLPLYIDRIDNLVITDGVSLGLDGFDAGVGCGQDNECNTGECFEDRCYDLLRGREFDGDFLSVAVRAAELSQAIGSGATPAEAQLFADGTTEAMILKEGEFCYAVFGGEELKSFNNAALRTDTVDRCTPGGHCCPVREGLLEPFATANFVQDQRWEQALRNCRTGCPTCEVVLTGHSWAGAYASIAGLSVGDLDPTVITYGRPPTLIGECDDSVNMNKTYRFVNGVFVNNAFVVDPVPNLENIFSGSSSDTNGISILLGPDDSNVNVYPPDEDSVTRFDEFNGEAHKLGGYINRLVTLRDSALGGTSIGLSGFPLGGRCNKDNECQFGQVCRASTCSLPFGVTIPPTPMPTPAPTTLAPTSSAQLCRGFAGAAISGVLLSIAAVGL